MTKEQTHILTLRTQAASLRSRAQGLDLEALGLAYEWLLNKYGLVHDQWIEYEHRLLCVRGATFVRPAGVEAYLVGYLINRHGNETEIQRYVREPERLVKNPEPIEMDLEELR